MQPAARPDRRRPGPAAGRQPHLVGGLGRPHPARQARRPTSARRCSHAGGRGGRRSPPTRSRQRLVTCGDAGSVARRLLERLALPAGAGRRRRPPGRRAADPRAARGLSRPWSPSSRACAPTRAPYGVNLAARARLPQPDHRGRARPGRARTATTLASTAPPSVGRAGVEKEYDAWLRGMPGYQRVAVDSMGRVLGDDGEVAGAARRHPGHLDRRQGAGRRRAAARRRRSRPRARPTTRSPHRNYVADSGAAVVMEAKTGRVVAMASQPTYDPAVWVGGITKQAAGAALLREGRHPAARPRDPGPVRARLDVEAVHDRRRARPTATRPDTRLDCSSGFQVGNRVVQELRVRRLRLHRLRQGAAGLLRHVLLPGRLRLLAAATAPTPTDVNAKDPLVEEAKAFGFGTRDRHRPARRGHRPDRRPALEARLLRSR